MLPCAIEIADFEASRYARFSAYAREAAEQAGLPQEAAERLELIVEELVLNIANHGYHGNAGPVAMELCQDGPGIRVRLMDQAPPFDPDAQASPDCSLPLSERPLGGLGIMLVKNMSDDMRYHRDGNRNILDISVRPRGESP